MDVDFKSKLTRKRFLDFIDTKVGNASGKYKSSASLGRDLGVTPAQLSNLRSNSQLISVKMIYNLQRLFGEEDDIMSVLFGESEKKGNYGMNIPDDCRVVEIKDIEAAESILEAAKHTIGKLKR